MFDFLTRELEELKDDVYFIKRLATFAADYFEARSLAVAYNRLIEYADDGMRQHPEAQRVPNLRYILLEHFILYADKHIRVQDGRIFNPAVLGSPMSLGDWQEAGYHTKRTTSNYPRRLRYWKAIFDQEPVKVETSRTTGEDIFGPVSKMIESRGRTPSITYAEVIERRNAYYGDVTKNVPWWMVFNYGSNAFGRAGYPSYPGILFIERAEQQVSSIRSQHLTAFDRMMGEALSSSDVYIGASEETFVSAWAKSHLPRVESYIDPDDMAMTLAFGVPF